MKKFVNVSCVLATSLLVFAMLFFILPGNAKGGTGIVSCVFCDSDATCHAYNRGSGAAFACGQGSCNCICSRGFSLSTLMWKCMCAAVIPGVI
jgi:hypothetical protein